MLTECLVCLLIPWDTSVPGQGCSWGNTGSRLCFALAISSEFPSGLTCYRTQLFLSLRPVTPSRVPAQGLSHIPGWAVPWVESLLQPLKPRCLPSWVLPSLARPCRAWLSFVEWHLSRWARCPCQPCHPCCRRGAVGPPGGDLHKGLGKVATPIPAGRPALAEHQICISELKHALFHSSSLVIFSWQPSPTHKLTPLLELTEGFVLHFSLCAAHLKMPIFSQSLYTHTILLPADGTGNQLTNPLPGALPSEWVEQPKEIEVGAVWMHPSAPASGTDCRRAFSSICIPAVLHTGETDRQVICNISAFLISSMTYPPSPHDFTSFLGSLCCTCYFLFYHYSL